MNKNSANINAGLRALAHKPNEIISGIVVSGSIDTSELTMSVQPSDDGIAIEGVRLNGIAGNGNGVVLYPEDGSDVIIGSIDGPGEWVLLQASDITKATVTIGDVSCTVDNTAVTLQNHDVQFNVGDSVFKMNTSSESMFNLLKDLITYISVMTVPTPAGTSGVPLNVTDFTNLLSRLDNLLTL